MRVMQGILVALIAGLGLSSGAANAVTFTLFTADVDSTGGANPIGAPADSNENLPPISPGVTLTPGVAPLDGVATGPLNGITYGPSAFSGNTGGTTGFVNSSFIFPVAGTFRLVWEVSDEGNRSFDSALAIDNVVLNGSSLSSFESGIPAAFTTRGTVATSGAVPNLAPTEGDSFAFLDTTGLFPSIFDTVDTTSGSRLISSAFDVGVGDVLTMDLAFLTNDGASFQDFGIAAVTNDVIPDPQPIPEPSSVLGTLAFGALGAGWMLKRKRQQKVAG